MSISKANLCHCDDCRAGYGYCVSAMVEGQDGTIERLELERSELMKLLDKAYEFISNGTDPEVATEDEFNWFARYKALKGVKS